jgi:hypothetical protein
MKRSIEYITCKNCGKEWGNHYKENCFGSDTVFEPRGYDLSDICCFCGRRLDEHINHLTCDNNRKTKKFKKEIYEFDDSLFEI